MIAMFHDAALCRRVLGLDDSYEPHCLPDND